MSAAAKPLAAIQPAKVPANRPGAPVPAKPAAAARVINEFQSDTTEIDTAPEPLAARALLLALAALVIFACVWAAIAQIDRIVSARGKIIATAPNVIVQPLETAVVRSIDAQVGDIVKSGQVLARLDPTFAQADVDQIEARIASLDSTIARLETEQAGGTYKPAPDVRFGYTQLQEAIWQERRTQYAAQNRVYDEKAARVRATILSQQQERDHLTSRLKILREVEDMRMQLEAAKTGSRLNSLLARDSRIEIERNLARTENAIIESRHELEGTEAERDVFRRQWDSKLIEELVTKRNERDSLTEQLVKARRRQNMIELVTPVDAVVLEVAPRSVGSIIKDAEPLFKLVPLDAPREVEMLIDARELGYVAVGDPVQLKLDAYPYQEHGMIEGVVRTISSDAFTETRAVPDVPEGAYYKARVALNPVELRNVPDTFQLIPGMPLNAEIKVGSRSVARYFLRPILRGLTESMREP